MICSSFYQYSAVPVYLWRAPPLQQSLDATPGHCPGKHDGTHRDRPAFCNPVADNSFLTHDACTIVPPLNNIQHRGQSITGT